MKFTVSENVEIVANGKRILLEAGDEIGVEPKQLALFPAHICPFCNKEIDPKSVEKETNWYASKIFRDGNIMASPASGWNSHNDVSYAIPPKMVPPIPAGPDAYVHNACLDTFLQKVENQGVLKAIDDEW